jgi:hypothetical protein
MPGLLLHVGAITNCVHQTGVVTATPLQPPRVFLNGTLPALGAADPQVVAGCAFTVGSKPQPCVIVRTEVAARVKVNGQPAAILTPLAMCYSVDQIAQGPPNALATQTRVVAT